MRRDDLRYNRKTKAAAVACFASCLIRPVKGFEYVGGLFRRNSGADANATGADSCCAAQTEQVCDSAKACCQADSAVCPKAACDSAKCDKPCEKK